MPHNLPPAPSTEPPVMTALERLEHTTNALDALMAAVGDYMLGQTEPPEERDVILTAAAPNRWSKSSRVSPSLGVYNGNGIPIFLGIDGAPASDQGRAWKVPAYSAIVIPLRVANFEIAALATDLAAGDAIVKTLRYRTLQPFMFSR